MILCDLRGAPGEGEVLVDRDVVRERAVDGWCGEEADARARGRQAPIIVTDAAVRDGLMGDRYILKILAIARQAYGMLVGI